MSGMIPSAGQMGVYAAAQTPPDSLPALPAPADSLSDAAQEFSRPAGALRLVDGVVKQALGHVMGKSDADKRMASLGLNPVLFSAETYQPRTYDSLPGPTHPPYVNIGQPKRFTLGNGLKVIVYPDHTLPVVTFYLGIDNRAVFEKEKRGVSDLTALMLLAGVENRTKNQITDSLANMGSIHRMTRNSFYVSGLKRYAQANFDLFADVVLRPNFPLQEFNVQKKEMRQAYVLSESRPDAILKRVYRALAFGDKHPSGEFISPSSIDKITLIDCQSYYDTYWRPNNAILLVMGDITLSEVQGMVNRRFKNWGAGKIPEAKVAVANDLPATSVDFIHNPSARNCRIVISNLAEFDYNSPDVFPAMIINQLMGGNLLANIQATLDGIPYAGDVFSLSPDPMRGGYMFLQIRAANVDVVRTLADKTDQLQRIRIVPLTEEKLDRIKRNLIGRIALSFEDRNAMGGYGVAVENGAVKKDFLEDILKQINAVTGEDVLRVAQKYIKPTQFRIVIYGDARKAVPPLELAHYDVRFYDGYAQRVDRPSLSQPITDSITAPKILEKYFEAMGGLRKMKEVKTLRQEYNVKSGDWNFTAVWLAKLPYNWQEVILYNGEVYQKRTFNGNMGYTKVERTRTDLKTDDVDKGRLVRSIFPLLDYQKESFKAEVDSIVPVRGRFAYRLRVTLPSADRQNYYLSMEDFMVLRIENVATPAVKEYDADGKLTKYVPEKIGSYTDYDDYKEVEGVKYPFWMEVRGDDEKILWLTTSVSPNVPLPKKMFY